MIIKTFNDDIISCFMRAYCTLIQQRRLVLRHTDEDVFVVVADEAAAIDVAAVD